MGAAAAEGGEMAAAVEAAAAAKEEERIMVSVRLRPLNAREAERGDTSDWECISATTVMFRSTVPERAMFPTAYTYDRVFRPECTSRQVYEEGAKDVALSVVSGINSSIFAYGQTSSGKTYTMTGITEYSMSDIYEYIEKHPEREFILKFSAIEIYNEAVRDLLSHDTTPLRLLDDPEKGTIVERLTEETLRDQSHLRELLAVCEAQRQIGETALNETSSRSHQILRLTIESSARQYLGRGNSSTLVACVNFVDLAGSERASQTASAGMRLKEGSHINRSLLTLGKVVRQLSKGRNGHIPYRDSKLTRILQSSLGGNARTAIICTMSPARSHIEQSRNTLLFATCAKEVVTNAQVNVVMSDKALVKHLQRELARLENELKYPGSASCATHADALREKDAQIKKLQEQLKELMEQRDTVQSQLDSLLKVVGDDHGDDRSAGQWDEHSQSSESLARIASEDALSLSDTDGVAYHNQHFGSAAFDASYVCNGDHLDPEHPEQTLELSQQTMDRQPRLLWQRPNNHNSNGPGPYQMKEVSSQAASEISEEHCKEVQCIEINELSRSKSEEFNLLLPQETNTDTDKLQNPEVEECSKDSVLQDEEQEVEIITKKMNDPIRTYPCEEEQQAESITKTVDDSVKLHSCESNGTTDNAVRLFVCDSDSNLSFDLGKPQPDETLALKRCIISSRDSALTRSRSCRASFMIIPNGWFNDSENTSRTPPDETLKYVPRRPEKVRRSLYSENDEYQNGDLPSDSPLASAKVISNEVNHKSIDNVEEENVISDISCVTETEEKAYMQEAQELEEIQLQRTVTEDFTAVRSVKDVGIDSTLSTIESPSRWPLDFEKKQQEIIELWHACNVSIVHRTYFFLLFKGDPADNIYMEVEHRRLSFIKNSFGAKSTAESELNAAAASSSKNIRREREMLYRQMLKKLSPDEKESIYTKWGIDLSTKQRRLQLSRRVWTQTDMEHVRESASLVARLIELLEPGQALKEMFGLSFVLTPRADRRSSSWIGSYSLK